MVIRSKEKLKISKPFNIVLVSPEIPPNTGNIARLCAATSSKLHLIHPLGFSIDDKHLKRAGLDYWHLLDIKEHENWEAFVQSHNVLRNEIALSGLCPSCNDNVSFWYFSTRGKKNIWDVKFSPGDYLIFGSETSGLSEDILNLSTNKESVISIPMNGLTRSINLSTAVGIVLYEGLRQLTCEKKVCEVVPI